jgi:6-pyruvoyltetrahydropterin/6-carboxytetrahydropterin synthase
MKNSKFGIRNSKFPPSAYVLARQVRFSINPFLSQDGIGYNSYSSKPVGEGLSIFLELSVELAGQVEPATGFVVNVTDIDNKVREFVVPVFAERIRTDFHKAKHIGLSDLMELLKTAWSRLADKFDKARLNRLSLKLNPFREVKMDSQESGVIFFSEKFEFAAMHKLWNDNFNEQRNFELFGKCANPTGHGHNYIVEVTIKKPIGDSPFSIAAFEKVVDDELIKVVDHKNLNIDVPEFGRTNPTVENIAAFAWSKLTGKFSPATLHCVTVWETDRTYCTYYG